MGKHLEAKEGRVWLFIYSSKTTACLVGVNGGRSGSEARCSQHYIIRTGLLVEQH